MSINKKGNECCGCTACASICSKDAITMEQDKNGFFYPVVSQEKCIECGMCDNVCQFHSHYKLDNAYISQKAYAVRHKKITEIETSRSGAAFIAISDWILDQGGVIYGVGFKDHFKVSHFKAITKRERNSFKGSKYVQSDLDGVFREVKDNLVKDIIVLFSGTACQIAGLKSYIGKSLQKKLYTIDIICYGVPSPKLWQDYLKYIEKRYNEEIIQVNFRDKEKFGWGDHKESFVFASGKKIYNDTFADLFGKGYIRRSCFVCPYTNLERVGDITLGDYWGWERTNEHFNSDNKGCSLVIINTQKGITLFSNIKSDINFIQARLEDITQNHLLRPTIPPKNIDEFENEYNKYGFKHVARKYGNIAEVFNDDTIVNKTTKTIRLYLRKIKNIFR